MRSALDKLLGLVLRAQQFAESLQLSLLSVGGRWTHVCCSSSHFEARTVLFLDCMFNSSTRNHVFGVDHRCFWSIVTRLNVRQKSHALDVETQLEQRSFNTTALLRFQRISGHTSRALDIQRKHWFIIHEKLLTGNAGQRRGVLVIVVQLDLRTSHQSGLPGFPAQLRAFRRPQLIVLDEQWLQWTQLFLQIHGAL
uniref:(northern house mosquito) hypothetical protein n=1 Tax=Culex pipiens TaxID=7175 RepID=A0A8D8FG44_CULPI